MARKTIEESKKIGRNTIINGYIFDEEKPGEKKLIYTINTNNKIITFHPSSKYYFFEKLTITGFAQLPEVFKKNGYSKNHILDYINRTFNDKRIKSVNVIKAGSSEIIKRGRNKHLYLSLPRLVELSDELGSMDFYHKRRKGLIANKQFNEDFPTIVKKKKITNPQSEIKSSIQSLSLQDIKDFDKEDISKITDIVASLMKSIHRTQITKSDIFKSTKLKIDTVTFDEVISNFEKLLGKKTSETTWGKFLEDNLFLIDSKYIHSLPQLNLVLAGARKVDFGLVDTQGYLDLFEIKKPETKLITSKKDTRGNYVWDRQAMEAIVQAEKYLLHAETKRNDLKDDIKRERQITLDVIRPRSFVIMGSSSQIDNEEKRLDFRMLKNQFKNIEIILYDELLDRIKNQKKSIEK